MRKADAVVVGGGVIGLSVAWRAAQRGLRVSVLERDEPGGGTSRVAAGMIGPISEARTTERPLLDLALQSARAYPTFVAELAAESGVDPRYLPCGTLAVARDADEAEALERELALRRELGLEVRRLRPSEARSLEPALAPTLRLALEVPDDHAIDPRALLDALAAAFVHAGGELRGGAEVAEVLVGAGERVHGVRLSSGEVVHAENVVLAAGVWTGSLTGLPPHARVPIHPVKGQIMRLHDPSGPGLLTHAVRMHPRSYIVPRGDGRYVLGATVEERGFDRSVTASGLFELLRDAVELVPGVGELVVDELSAGLRPATPDNAPVVGPGALAGLHWATGHYRHGILLAPITARIAVECLDGAQPPAALSPARFANVPVTV
jgi:glycine oxidase